MDILQLDPAQNVIENDPKAIPLPMPQAADPSVEPVAPPIREQKNLGLPAPAEPAPVNLWAQGTANDPVTIEPETFRERIITRMNDTDATKGGADQISKRSFKGLGDRTQEVNPNHIEVLRKNQNDPEAVAAFDMKYGEGTAQRYLNLAKKDHIDTLVARRNDPEARAAFDMLYGPNMADLYIPLYDPRADRATQIAAAIRLRNALAAGVGFTDTFEQSFAGEVTGAAARGVGTAVQELFINSPRSLYNTITGSDLQRIELVPKDDLRAIDYQITTSLVEGISQVATGLGLGFALAPGAGATGLAGAIRGMSIGAIVDAFGTRPDDPMLADVIGKVAGFDPKNNDVLKFLSNEFYQSDMAKRVARAVEGLGVGLLIDGLVKLGRAARSGDEALKNEAADIIERAGKVANDNGTPFGVRGATDVPQVTPAQIDTKQAGKVPAAANDPKAPRANPRVAANENTDPLSTLANDNTPKRPNVPNAVDTKAGKRPPKSANDNPEPPLPNKDLPANDNVTNGKVYEVEPFDPTRARKQTREENLVEAIEPRVVREVKEAIAPKAARTYTDAVDDRVRKVLDDIPDVPNVADPNIDKIITPHVQRFMALDLSRSDLEGLMKARYTPDELLKLHVLVNQANKRATAEINTINNQYRALMEAGRGAEADNLVQGALKRAEDLKAKYDKLDEPIGTLAGRLLYVRKVERDIANAAAVRERIDALRANGLSTEEIASVIADAIDRSRPGYKMMETFIKRIKALETQIAGTVDPALKKAMEKDLAKVTADFDKALEALTKETAKGVLSRTRRVLDMVVELKLNALLYSLKTVAVTVPIGNMMNVAVRTAGEFFGTMLQRGMRDAFTITAAKYTGMRAGYTSGLDMLQGMFAAGRRAFVEERAVLTADSFTEMYGKAISSGALGLNPAGVTGKTVDTVGKVVRVPTRLLAFNDDFIGSAIARSEVGAHAAMNFLDQLRVRKSELTTILKDPTLPPARRTALQAELDGLRKNPTIAVKEVDNLTGKPVNKAMTKQEYIEWRVKNAFDETGTQLIDNNVAQAVDEVLLKNAFESKFMKDLEGVATNPVSRLLFQPFFRAPIRAMQAGFEMIPILGRMSPTFRDALSGARGPREQAIAKGKVMLGWALSFYIANKIANNEVTAAGPNSAAERRVWLASGWKPNSIKIGGEWWDYSNAEPLGTMIKVYANFYRNMETYGVRKDKEEAVKEAMLAMATGVVTSITDSSMLTGAQKTLQMLGVVNKEDQAGRVMEKFAGEQLASFIPAFLKQINNTFDTRMVENMQIADYMTSALFNKEESPKVYDLLGNPLLDGNPGRALFGMASPLFYPIPRRDVNQDLWTLISLKNISVITGADFKMDTKVPDAKVGDMRLIKAHTKPGYLIDVFHDQYRKVTIDGLTVGERLYALLKSQKHTDDGDLPMSIGNARVDGKLTDAVQKIITMYRKEAWAVTAMIEKDNPELNKERDRYNMLKLQATDPQFDKPVPSGLDILPGINR